MKVGLSITAGDTMKVSNGVTKFVIIAWRMSRVVKA